jgi:6,7-dimethyl-8-ribityllumazine synthase
VSSGAQPHLSELDGRGLRIGIVAARWNDDIVGRLLAGAETALVACGVDARDVTVVRVAGAVELPLLCQALADREDIDAVIALGCVIRGDTGHYDVVVSMASQGIARVALDAAKPVIFGVLTTENHAQALDRAGGALGNNGAGAAAAAIDSVLALRRVRAVVSI